MFWFFDEERFHVLTPLILKWKRVLNRINYKNKIQLLSSVKNKYQELINTDLKQNLMIILSK